MKLFLLTCLVAVTLAAPSERTKRSILPGDPRYDGVHEHPHKVHEHHENEVEIARALSKTSGCLSPLGLAKGYGVQGLQQETSLDSTNLLAHDVGAAVESVIESYGSETSGVDKAVEQPESIPESSPTLLKQEPVSSIKSGNIPVANAAAFTETVDVATQTQGTATVVESAKSDDKDSIVEEGTHSEARSTNEAQEASSSAVAQTPKLVKSDNKASPLEEGTKLEAKSAYEAQEASSGAVAQAPELVKSDNKVSHLEEETKLEAKSANEAQEASAGAVAQTPELVKSDNKVSPLEEGTKLEAKSANEAQEASAGAVAQAPELVKSDNKASPLEEGTKLEAKSANEAQEASSGAVAQTPELVKSDNEASPLEVGTNLEVKSANDAQGAALRSFAQTPESVESDNQGSPLEEGIKLEAESANEAQDASSGAVAQTPELVKSDGEASPLEVGTNLEAKPAIETQEALSGAVTQNLGLTKSDDKDSLRTESATGAQEASSVISVHPQLVEPSIDNSDYKYETTHEAKSAIHAEQHTNVEEVSSHNSESNIQLAEPHVSDSQPDQSHDIGSHPQNDGEAYIVSSDPSLSATVIPANDAGSPVEAPSSDADAATGSSATPFESSFRSSFGSGFNGGFGSPISSSLPPTPSEAPSSDANPATGSSATPFESSFRSSFGPAFNSGFGSAKSPALPSSISKSPSSDVHPATGSSLSSFDSKFGSPYGSTFNSNFGHSFPPSSVSGAPSYNTGYNTYDHSRYNPNIHPGYGHAPGFGGYNANYGQYNNNYGRLGYNGANYYPGHPFGVGIHSGYDQGLNGKTISNSQVPVGFPHPYPVDYTKNVPYAQPPSFQYRTGYYTPQSVPSFPSIQQTREQSIGEQASQSQEQLPTNYQSPDSLVQPTAASFQK